MKSFIYDTSVLSALLDHEHPKHEKTVREIEDLPDDSKYYVSSVSLAELAYGAEMAQSSPERMNALSQMLSAAMNLDFLGIGPGTSLAYANLKSNVALLYMPKVTRQERRRIGRLEDWPDNFRGKTLQVDENDLWLCAQSKERSVTLLTSDKRMMRIKNADDEVSLKII